MLSIASILWLGFSVSLISASPIGESVTDTDIELIKRDVIGAMKDQMPGCNKEDDPSYTTEHSRWENAEEDYGYKFAEDQCHNKEILWKYKCWTDFFLTEVYYEYDHWRNVGIDIACDKTENCATWSTSLNSTCTSWTTSWDNKGQGTIELKKEIASGSLLGKFLELIGVVGKGSAATVKGEYSHSWGGNIGGQTCLQTGQTGRCQWNDQGCHAFWLAQRNKVFSGYAQRVCTTKRNTILNQKRKSGSWTVGKRDFSITIPDNWKIGCGATCGQTPYPDNDPPTGDAIKVNIKNKDDLQVLFDKHGIS